MRAIGYIRVSTTHQGDGESLDAQEAAIRRLCAQKEWSLLRVASDEESGRKKERDGWRSVVDAYERGECDVVVALKLDRVTRSVRHFAGLIETTFKDGGLYIIKEQLDLNSAVGRMMANVLATFAQFEAEMCAERTKFALAEKRGRGEKLGGRPPWGFKVEVRDGTNVLVASPDERAMIAECVRLRENGLSLARTANALNRAGFATRAGGAITVSTVRRLLQVRI